MKAADQYEMSTDKEQMTDMVIEVPTEKWDCETILSKYSNVNTTHFTLIFVETLLKILIIIVLLFHFTISLSADIL